MGGVLCLEYMFRAFSDCVRAVCAVLEERGAGILEPGGGGGEEHDYNTHTHTHTHTHTQELQCILYMYMYMKNVQINDNK